MAGLYLIFSINDIVKLIITTRPFIKAMLKLEEESS